MDKAYWIDEQESGPPTIEDDQWFQIHVASKDYPKLKREPKQLEGQMSLRGGFVASSLCATHGTYRCPGCES